MSRTISRLFNNRADAENAVGELEANGVPSDDISIVASNAAGSAPGEDRSFGRAPDARSDPKAEEAAEDAGKGAALGGVVGAGAGLLTGLGLMAIPGVGPVVAAGWLVSTLAGAGAGAVAGGAAGGVIGALSKAGLSEDEAHVYAEGVRRGGTLVSVRAEDTDAARIEQLLSQRSTDAVALGSDYRRAGWTGFDEGPGAPGSRPL
ncbi:MAG: hypothetical protein JO127_01580 [Caulobacteraceae bacterium]|nr:hypothetical protein [Caulobacteraceae bacterium]